MSDLDHSSQPESWWGSHKYEVAATAAVIAAAGLCWYGRSAAEPLAQSALETAMVGTKAGASGAAHDMVLIPALLSKAGVGAGLTEDSMLFSRQVLSHEVGHEAALLPQMTLVGSEGANIGRAGLSQISETGISKAFKVLSEDGHSPAAPSVEWSLPKKSVDGTWIPGKWNHVDDTAVGAYQMNGIQMPMTSRALHVSNVPSQWRLGLTKFRVFEAELDPASQVQWNALSQGTAKYTGGIANSLRDFGARSVRLTREVTGDELTQLMR